MIDLQGKVALVSGAGSGIGEATAKLLAEANASVVVADIDIDNATRVADEIDSTGATAFAHPVDISDETAVRELFEAVATRFGRLDILDNNAGLVGRAQLEADLDVASLDPEVWDRSFAVNARGTMLMCRQGIPLLLAAGGGSIINITSTAALWGDVRSTAYGSSKAAVIALTRYVATQHLKQGIRCNAIAPGLVVTPASRAVSAGPLMDAFDRHQSFMAEPRDIANVVLFLASELSTFVTGQILSVDGGLLMNTPILPERMASVEKLKAQ